MARGHGKGGHLRRGAARLGLAHIALAVGGSFALHPPALGADALLPTGGQIVAGSGSLRQQGNTLTVTQDSARLATDWQSFSIGAGQRVVFIQPSDSAVALNRVVGNDVSTIQGALSANGRVYLVNPNGVLFTPTAQVNVGALVASTLNIGLTDFMAGRDRFEGDSTAAVINQGTLQALAADGRGGTLALVAARIVNTGVLQAPGGQVLLGAGRQVVLDLGGPAALQVTEGALQAAIDNGGALRASGGMVVLSARGLSQLVSSVIRHSGQIEATSLRETGGRVVLEADDITLASGSRIDARGASAGGTVLVGGDWQGSGPLRQATHVTLAEGAQVDVSATAAGGSGGKVVLWSQLKAPAGSTLVDGDIQAQGGPQGGTGGRVETSGHQLGVRGRVDAGQGGQWLLDPADVTITGSDSGYSVIGTTFTPNDSAASVSIQASTLVAALNAGSDVTVTTQNTGTAGSGSGNITVASALSTTGTTAGALSLVADQDITLNASIALTGTGKALLLKAKRDIVQNAGATIDTAGGAVTFQSDSDASHQGAIHLYDSTRVSTQGGNITMGGGTDPTVEAAYGSSSHTAGIALRTPGGYGPGAQLNAGGGDIRLTGVGTGAGNGIDANYGVTLATAGTGNVTLNGTAGATGYGVVLDRTLIQVANGNVSVQGTAISSSAYAMTMLERNGTQTVNGVVSTGNGTIQLNGIGGQGLWFGFSGNPTLGGSSYGGNISLVSDKMTFSSTGGAWVDTSGTLTLTPQSSSFNGTLDTGYLRVSPRVSTVTIGSATNTSAVTFGGLSGFTSAVNVWGGDITVGQAVTWSTGSLTLNASNNVSINAALQGSGDAVLNVYYGQGAVAAGNTSAYTVAGGVTLPAGQHFNTKQGSDGALVAHTVLTALGSAGSTTGTDLQGLNGALTGHYVLGADLDATATAQWNGGQGFTPIGNDATPFTGTFDGLGHVVTGLTISGASQAGLFGTVGSGALVQQVGLLNTSISGARNAGAIAGTNAGGTITRVFAEGTVSASNASGGLVGYNAGAGTLNTARFAGTVSGTGTGSVGGVVGENTATLANTYATATVGNPNGWAGGLVGYNFGTVGTSYASGVVTGLNAGALVGGNNAYANVTDSYWNTTQAGSLAGWSYNNGGLSNATGLTTAQLQQMANLSGFSFSVAPGSSNQWVIVNGAGGLNGNGTQGNGTMPMLAFEYSTRIATATQLQLASMVTTASYTLARDIDASATGGGTGVWGTAGFVPIGVGSASGYRGTFDGASHTISDLTIARSSQNYVGLIGGANSAAVIRNVGVYNASVSGGQYVGMLAGVAYTVSDSYAIGSVSGSSRVGGLLGQGYGAVTNVYSSGTVSGTSLVGGLIGASSGSVSLAYADTAVTGTSTVGGFIGQRSGTVASSSWNTSKNPTRAATGSGSNTGITGLTTSAMLSSSSFSALDFSSKWLQYEGTGTPLLRAFLTPLTVTAANTTKAFDGSTFTTGGLSYSTTPGANLLGTPVYTLGSSGTDVGSTTISVSGLYSNQRGYAITYANGTASITARPVTVTVDDKTKTYGDADPTWSYQITTGSMVGSDTLSATLSRTAGDNAGSYPISGSITAGSNYAVTVQNGTLTISARPITVTADNKSKVYGDGDPTLTYQVTSGSLVGSDTLSGALTRTAGSNVGTYTIDASALANGNYSVTANNGTLTISARPIAVTADNKSKVYGDSDPTLTYQVTSGSLVGSDSLSGSLSRAAGTNVGTYTIDASALANGNYSVTANNGTLTISARPITVTADNKSKVYGDSDPTLTYQVTSGSLVGSDSLSGSLSRAAGTNVGTYTIDASALTNGNYNVTANNGTLTISARPITVTADNKSKVYGDSDPTLTYQVTSGSLVGSDALSGSLSRAAGSNVGTYTIDASALDNGNYTVTANNGTLTISARPITVTSDNKSKVYGDSDPALTYQVTSGSLVGSDALSGSLSRAAGTNVGTYTIDASALTNGNYNVTANNGTLTISARPITVTADNKSKVYGDSDPALTYQVTSGSLVDSDALSGSLSRAAGTNVGTYTIDASALTNGNYNVTANNGTLTISARPITVTADNKSKVYGDSDPTLTYQVTSGSLVGSDALSGSLSRAAGSNVGTYTIDASALTNGNYSVAANNGTLTISPRPITVTADNKSKVYGDSDPTLTYQVTSGSLVGSDALSGALSRTAGSNVGTYTIDASALANGNYSITANNGTLTISARPITVTADNKSKVYGDSDPTLTYQVSSGSLIGSDSLSGSLSRAAGSDVGTYTIDAGTLTNGNYNVTANNGTLTISARPITVTADNKSKVYGDGDPTLTYQVTSGSLVGSDSLSGSLSRAAGSDVGTYTIDASALANGNYSVTANNGMLTISARPITVTADNKSKVYGDGDPALTYQVTSGSLVGSDALSGTLTRTAGSNVGAYTIDASALANGNYNVTANNGTLTISARPITVTADNKSKVYGDSDPTLTYQVTSGSLVGSDSLSGSLSRAAGTNVGAYTIDASALANGNYNVTANNGTLTISARPITVTADNKSKVYGDGDPTLTYQVTSGSLVGSDTLSGSLTRAAGTNVGTYTIDASALANGNYSVTANNGTLTISARPITVTADNKSKVYGDSDPTLTYQVTSGSLIGSDALSGSLSRAAGSNVGTYTIDASALANGNYSVTANNGTLTISPRPITVTADNKSKLQGEPDPTLTYQVTSGSLVGSDTLSGGLARTIGQNAGTYTIDATALSNGNYLVTAHNGTLTITAANRIDDVKVDMNRQVSLMSGAPATSAASPVAAASPSTAAPSAATPNSTGLQVVDVPADVPLAPHALGATGVPGLVQVLVVNGGIQWPESTSAGGTGSPR